MREDAGCDPKRRFCKIKMYIVYKFALAKQGCPLYNKIRTLFGSTSFLKGCK